MCSAGSHNPPPASQNLIEHRPLPAPAAPRPPPLPLAHAYCPAPSHPAVGPAWRCPASAVPILPQQRHAARTDACTAHPPDHTYVRTCSRPIVHGTTRTKHKGTLGACCKPPLAIPAHRGVGNGPRGNTAGVPGTLGPARAVCQAATAALLSPRRRTSKYYSAPPFQTVCPRLLFNHILRTHRRAYKCIQSCSTYHQVPAGTIHSGSRKYTYCPAPRLIIIGAPAPIPPASRVHIISTCRLGCGKQPAYR